jgi:hypothetical protein
MTEKEATKTTVKKTKAPVVKVDGNGGVKAEKKKSAPAAVTALAKELKVDPETLLGWNVYPDRVVIIAQNGMKFSRSKGK